MQLEWKTLSRAAGLKVEGDEIHVSLGTGRKQLVQVSDARDTIRLHSFVARAAIVAQIENVSLRAWQRNRAVALVSFRIDQKGRLLGESWVPKIGLNEIEFQLYVITLAVECDRFEQQFTGHDVE
jgi:hypothetical protein